MATDVKSLLLQKLTPKAARGAQCPSCFTFNMPHHLPENRKARSASGVELICALCGTRYPTSESPARAA